MCRQRTGTEFERITAFSSAEKDRMNDHEQGNALPGRTPVEVKQEDRCETGQRREYTQHSGAYRIEAKSVCEHAAIPLWIKTPLDYQPPHFLSTIVPTE